jgi:hypothetical protein
VEAQQGGEDAGDEQQVGGVGDEGAGVPGQRAEHQSRSLLPGRGDDRVRTGGDRHRPRRQRVEKTGERDRDVGGGGHRTPRVLHLFAVDGAGLEAGERGDAERQDGPEAGGEEVGRRQPVGGDGAAGRVGQRHGVVDGDRRALQHEQHGEHGGVEVDAQHAEHGDHRHGAERPHPPPRVDAELAGHEVAEDGAEEPVEADLDGVVGDEGDKGAGDPGGAAQAVGDVRVERAGVGDVPAHRRVPHHEDGQDDGEQQIDQRRADVAGHGEHRRHAAAQHGQRRRRRDREEDQVEDAQAPGGEPAAVHGVA